jgi:hypothetical protein
MQEFTDKTAPFQLPLEAFGIEMRVCTNTPELIERVEQMILPGWRRDVRRSTQQRLGLLAEDNDMYSIYNYDGICIHDAPGVEYALMMLQAQIEGHVALEAPSYIFVHAGVVADGNRAIVMPGSSFSGKSTLVRALVEAGAVYYSDEFAVLDDGGRVHPYPRPLSYRPPFEAAIEYNAEQLGSVAGEKPIEIGLVIATHYRSGAEWDPRELSSGAGALALLENTVPAQERPDQSLRYVTRAATGAAVLEGERGEAEEVAGVLLDTLRAAA